MVQRHFGTNFGAPRMVRCGAALLAVTVGFETARRLQLAGLSSSGVEIPPAFLHVAPPRELRASQGSATSFALSAAIPSQQASFASTVAVAAAALAMAGALHSLRRPLDSAARRSAQTVQLRAEKRNAKEEDEDEDDAYLEGQDDDVSAASGDEDFEDSEDEEGGEGAVYSEDDRWLYKEDDGSELPTESGEKLEARCRAKYLKGSPQKFRRVLWQIRGRTYREALMLLEFMPWRHCKPTLVALQSAAANAQNHFNMDKSRLYISKCQAEAGPVMKRMRPVSKGQSHGFVRRTTNLVIHVAEMNDEQLAKAGAF